MIYKSFIRKKTSIIYFIIYTLLFTVLGILINVQNTYISKENEYHRRSKIIVETNDTSIFKEINNIDSYDKVVIIDNIGPSFELIGTDELADNNIIISDENIDDVKINDIITINYNNIDYELIVVGYSDKLGNDFYYVSNEFIKKLDNIKTSNYYSINLKNWLKYQNTLDNIYELGKFNTHFFNGSDQNSDGFLWFYIRAWIFLSLLIITFIVVIIITCINIASDEENNNKLYKTLGFHRLSIVFINIKKILILVIGALLLSYLLILLINH